jgi:ankyrin repeat protein
VTPLESAVRGGRLDVASVLLDGAPPAGIGALLCEAALKNQREIADLLLRKGADANARDASGATPLHAAALKGNLAVAELLLARGAKVDLRDGDGLTPLHNAAVSGHADVAALLLDRGADREARDTGAGATPLFQAAAWGRKSVVELLLKRGADGNAKNLSGVSPAEAAAKNGFADIARLLKERSDPRP